MSFNKITIVGYLGRDPELRYMPQGTAVCNFSVATTGKRRNASGETEEHTIWFRVTAWGRQAEVANEYLAKGGQVYVEGRLRLAEYTDRESNPRTSAEVNASEIHFLGQRGDATNGTAEGGDDNNRADEEAEIVEKPKPASSRSGKKSGSKRAPTKEDNGAEEHGIVEDNIPFQLADLRIPRR